MKAWRKLAVFFFSVLALCAVAGGVYGGIHSSLFTLRVVEVADLPERAPVTAETITHLVALAPGKTNLYQVDLKSVERRILAEPWIREVHLQKRFPQTLSIGIEFREPRALIQTEGGVLAYVDQDGKVFGRVNLALPSDLPTLAGIPGRQIPAALHLLAKWESSPLGKTSQISTLSWDSERGYRALAVYPLHLLTPQTRDDPSQWSRVSVELGPEVDGNPDLQLKNLTSVFAYLTKNSIASHQIWADIGKKIVVKTAHGS